MISLRMYKILVAAIIQCVRKVPVHLGYGTYIWLPVWKLQLKFGTHCSFRNRPGSSVGTATDYGLDGSGIESRLGRAFSHTSRPALPSPPQPPVQWVPGLSRG
jgi:hypothetical protein